MQGHPDYVAGVNQANVGSTKWCMTCTAGGVSQDKVIGTIKVVPSIIEVKSNPFTGDEKPIDNRCACLGETIANFNDGTLYFNGKGTYCSDWNNDDDIWCYRDPQCDGSTPTFEPEWSSQISVKSCSNTLASPIDLTPTGWSEMFYSTSGCSGCPNYFDCSLYETDTTGSCLPNNPFSSSMIQITTDGKIQLDQTGSCNVFEFCVVCKYDTKVIWRYPDGSNVNKEAVLATQSAQNPYVKVILGCCNTLTTPGPVTPVSISFDESTSSSYLSINPNSDPNWNNLFQNSLASMCPVSSCIVNEQGPCTDPLSDSVAREYLGTIDYNPNSNYFAFSPSATWSNVTDTTNQAKIPLQAYKLVKYGTHQWCQWVLDPQVPSGKWIRVSAWVKFLTPVPQATEFVVKIQGNQHDNLVTGMIQDQWKYVSIVGNANPQGGDHKVAFDFSSSPDGTEVLMAEMEVEIFSSQPQPRLFDDNHYIQNEPLQLSAKQDSIEGYSKEMCVKCSNQDDAVSFNWSVQQSPAPCYGVFTNPQQNPVTELSYSSQSSTLIYPSEVSGSWDWDSYFKNIKPSQCQIENCYLLHSDCMTTWQGLDTISYQYPPSDLKNIQISVKRHQTSFQDTFCLKCSNHYDEAQFQWTVKFKGCEADFLGPESPPVPLNLIYNSSVESQVIMPQHNQTYTNSPWAEFLRSENRECSIKGCRVVSSDCVIEEPAEADPSQNLTWCADLNNYCSCDPGSLVYFGETDASGDLDTSKQQGVGWVYKIFNFESIKCKPSNFPSLSHNQAFKCFCQPLQHPWSNHLSISQTNTFEVKASRSILDGYSHSVCVACQNVAGQWAKSGPWNISLSSCGSEEVSLAGPDILVHNFVLNSPQNRIEPSSFEKLFKSSLEICKVSQFKLLKKSSGGELLELQDPSVTMNSNFSISVDTSQLMQQTLYIEASTGTSASFALLELKIYVNNFAPFFSDGAPESQIIQTEASQIVVYQIPEMTDVETPEQSSILLEVSGLDQTFMSFDETLNQISFTEVPEGKAGTYTLEFTLEDTFGETTTYFVDFDVRAPQIVEEEPEDSQTEVTPEPVEVELPQDQPDEPKEEIKSKIDSMDYFGITTIYFSKDINKDLDIKQIDEDFLEVFVEPVIQFDPSEDNENVHLETRYNLQWKPVSFEGQYLQIDVDFNHPKYISPNIEQDILTIRVKDSEEKIKKIFGRQLRGANSSSPIVLSNRLLKTRIPRQLEYNEKNRNFVESTQLTTQGLFGTMVGAFVLQMFLTGALAFLIGWINILQMIIHLPMLKVMVPQNVNTFFQIILPFVTFDLIPPEWSTELIFTFEEFPEEGFKKSFNDKFFGQLQDLGYDTHNSVLILGSLWVFTALFFFRLFIVLPLLNYLSRKFKWIAPYSKKLFHNLVWGEFILLAFEAYLEFLIGGYINVLFQLNSQNGEYAGVVTGYYTLLVAVIILPGLMIYVIMQPVEVLKNPEFEQKWGVLYENFRLDGKWTVACNLLFMVRRMIFVVIAFNLDTTPGIQLVFVNLLNLFCCVYYGHFRPFNTKLKRFLDGFNELLLTVVTWHMILFTQFVHNSDTQYQVGWSMIYCIGLNGFINLSIFLWFGGRILFLIGKRLYNEVMKEELPVKVPKDSIKDNVVILNAMEPQNMGNHGERDDKAAEQAQKNAKSNSHLTRGGKLADVTFGDVGSENMDSLPSQIVEKNINLVKQEIYPKKQTRQEYRQAQRDELEKRRQEKFLDELKRKQQSQGFVQKTHEEIIAAAFAKKDPTAYLKKARTRGPDGKKKQYF